MKKFIVLIGVIAILIGLRLEDNSLLTVARCYDAELTVYNKGGSITIIAASDLPFLGRFNDSIGLRVDIRRTDDEQDAIKQLLGVEELWTETVDDLTIVYGFSRELGRTQTVHGKEVNFMMAYSDELISIGCPILQGSY